jgi:hypothetical protein
MKAILFSLLLLPSFGAAQDYYAAKDYTCNELNEILDQKGQIRIKYQSFFGGYGTHIAERSMCPKSLPVGPCYKVTPAAVKAKDRTCGVGYKCRRENDSDKC